MKQARRSRDVYVDVFPWLEECAAKQRYSITGPSRLAAKLVEKYAPAVVLGEHEYLRGLKYLEHVIGPIEVFTPESLLESKCKVWLSIALDHTSPVLPTETSFKRAAILHDTFGVRGVLDQYAKNRFFLGTKVNELLLYVSEASRNNFQLFLQTFGYQEERRYLPFPNCHHFTEFPEPSLSRDMARSLSVHSLYPYKNIERSVAVSATLGCKEHVHIGDERRKLSEKLASHELMFERGCVRPTYLGPVGDNQLTEAYLKHGTFICTSKIEGFSMPPMEALICQVPRVVLSDIPVHLELYRDFATFVFPEWDGCLPSDVPFTDEKQAYVVARHLYETYTAENMMRAFDRYVESL